MSGLARPAHGIAVVGYGAISALGRGNAAFAVSAEREVTCVGRDEELAAAGLRKPYSARAKIDAEGDRATVMLQIALADCEAMLDVERPAWRGSRVGLVLGTSSGGMRAFTEGSGRPMDRTYAGPVAANITRSYAPASVVLGACASSAIAIGLGRAWLEAHRCDVVLAGGFDAVSVFVAAGFECLRATSDARGPRPFRKDRNGLALGEGAAVVALARAAKLPENVRISAWITGFGTTCDAHHLTQPHPEGAGLARAARAAAADAGAPHIDLIGAHGTATHQNDSAESKTLSSLAGTEAGAASLAGLAAAPAFSFKGTIGHTLGAAGALETLALLDALSRGIAPSTVGEGEVEDGVRLLDRAEPLAATTALKLSAAFGGANAALVVSRAAGVPARVAAPAHDVFVTRAVLVGMADLDAAALAARTGYPIDRITRADDLVRLALAASAALKEAQGSLRGAGVIVGLGLATIETNAKFQSRIARPEPRRFPYTTPNAAAGECAVAFGLDGPAFAVGGGPHGGLEAIAIAADLVHAGLAERIVVIAADEAGEASEALAPGTKSGAIALIVQRAPAAAKLTAWHTTMAPSQPSDAATLLPMHAHPSLAPLVDENPTELRARVPWGGESILSLTW